MKLNRNHLKIIAVLSMLVDHIGVIFFPKIIFLRIVGRISFPIFAFFVAEGWHYTHNKARYAILLFVFALVSFVPHLLAFKTFALDILFTFLISLGFIELLNLAISEKQLALKILKFVAAGIIIIVLLLLEPFGLIEYGVCGVLVVAAFYYYREHKFLKYFFFAVLMLLLTTRQVVFAGAFSLGAAVQIFSLLALPFLMLYNGQKGKLNLKYLFYIFYPAHLLVLGIISLLI